MTRAGCLLLLVSLPPWAFAQSYSTSFRLTENPVSEGGKWIGGRSAGSNLWGDVQTSGGMAYGVSEPTKFGDPTGVLTGSWAPDQQAQVTVKIARTPAVCCHEIEVRLRTTIGASTITGYEVYCSVVPGSRYCHIARWTGPNGLYCNIEPSTPSIVAVDGDVLKGTVTGSNPAVITGYLNGVQIMQVSDTGNEGGDGTDCGAGRPVFTSGAPGVGFYDDQNDHQWSFFGVSSFAASAESERRPSPPARRPSGRSPGHAPASSPDAARPLRRGARAASRSLSRGHADDIEIACGSTLLRLLSERPGTGVRWIAAQGRAEPRRGVGDPGVQ